MTIDPADYIIALMRRETDALGFIPAPHIRNHLVAREQYLIQTDGHAHPRGYLLHGPPKPGRPLRIYQVCVDIDHRRILYATRMIETLRHRARTAGATRILLRCAADLPANQFWLALGAKPILIQPGGKRRNRLIITYDLPLFHTPPEGTPAPNRV